LRTLLYIVLFITCALPATAQKDSSFQFQKTWKVSGGQLAVDNLSNLYVINNDEQLKKYSPAGDSIAVYNEMKRFGKLHTIDVSNPLKLLLYYKDFATVVVLDRLLALRTSLDLRRHNIQQASAIGLSYDNNIWVFDALNYKLKKLDEQGNQQMETEDFRTLFGNSFNPVTIIDQNNSVYLYDPAVGVYQFDHFGTFQKKHPITNWQNIAIIGKHIVGISNNGLYVYNTSTLLEHQYQFPSSFGSFSQYIIGNTALFGLDKEAVHKYSFRF
jgi:hypothetical protein